MILDLFAGPGGWDQGLRMLGRTDVVGIEWEKWACVTARAAGHRRAQADIATLTPRRLGVGHVEGVIGSPPCQAWSMSGKRKGELDRAACHELADRMAEGDDSTDWRTWEDDRSPLVCEPIRWIRDLRPDWVALEEVPPVASLWEHFARILTRWGYHVWTGDLCAADYGVPQTRVRRILTAHLHRRVGPPPPTHADTAHGDDLFGGRTQPWVTMAEALGWGFNDAPSATISGGGGGGGGPEPYANSAYRRRLAEVVLDRRTNSKAGNGTLYPTPVGIDRPAPTVTGAGNQVWRYRNGTRKNAASRSLDEPAPTIMFGHSSNEVSWVAERPATTVVASFRPDIIAGPGHHKSSRQDAPGSVRVTVQEAGILQSFPADYPWAGPKTRQYEQVGNAVPPLLAAHVLASLGVGTLHRIGVTA